MPIILKSCALWSQESGSRDESVGHDIPAGLTTNWFERDGGKGGGGASGSGRQGAGPSVVQELEGHTTHPLDYLPVPAGVTKGRLVLIPEVSAVIWQADLKDIPVSFLDLYPRYQLEWRKEGV